MNIEGETSKTARNKNLSLDVLTLKLKKNYEFFASLNDDEIHKFLGMCNSQPFKEGMTIFEEGEREAVWFIILSGRVCIYRGDKVLGYLSEGQGFGEVGLLKNAPHSASAKAETDTILLAVQRTILSETLPAIGYKILEYIASQLAEKLIQANLQIENMGIKD